MFETGQLVWAAAASLLLAVPAHLGFRLLASTRSLRRQLAAERAIAHHSMRLGNCPLAETGAHIRGMLAEIGRCMGAHRAYLMLDGSPSRTVAWAAPGVPFPPGWPMRARHLPLRPGAVQDYVAMIEDVGRLPEGVTRSALLEAGVRGWVCLSFERPGGLQGIIGFDSPRPIVAADLPCRYLLRMAGDVAANALERELLEHDRARLAARTERLRRIQTIGVMASGIAHNFNNIIGGILGYAEIADEEVRGGTRVARYLYEIRRAADSGRDLIDGILAFGRQSKANRPVRVADLLMEAASLLRAALPGGTKLAMADVEPGLAVFGDPVQLQQVVMNLCTNASQAMEGQGCVHVEAELQVVPDSRRLSHGAIRPGRYVRLSVRDTGCGFDTAVASRLFEPFFTTRPAGTGLGLATVHEIMRDHDGAMHIESTPGRGSTFEAWLPAEPADGAAVVQPAPVLGHGETVLLLDEERDQLLGGEDILAGLGYEPVGFGHAADAIAAVRACPARFDAIVIGCVRPTPDALAVARTLHGLVPQRPILLASTLVSTLAPTLASTLASTLAPALAPDVPGPDLAGAGIVGVLCKPLVEADVAAALARWMSVPGAAFSRTVVALGDHCRTAIGNAHAESPSTGIEAASDSSQCRSTCVSTLASARQTR